MIPITNSASGRLDGEVGWGRGIAMRKVRTIAALLLGLIFIVFGANYFLDFFTIPAGGVSTGERLLQAMRDGGLMSYVAFSHIVAGILLVVPRTQFLGALLQLPMVIGITSFHLSMLPAGVGMAAFLLLLNIVALADAEKWRRLFEKY
jgi:putative oxidoreductase